MAVKLLITTYKRVDKQITLPALLEAGLEPTLVVQAREERVYRQAYPDVPMLVLPPNIRRLAPTRAYLIKRFRKHKLVLLDDDLSFFYRPDPNDWHLKQAGPKQLRRMFKEIDKYLDQYVHVGVSARGGNNLVEQPYAINTRYMRVLCYNCPKLPSGLQIERAGDMGDFDVNLQLLRKGYPNLVLYKYAQDHPGTQWVGGCSAYRTLQLHNRIVKKMAVWHKGFVRVREKHNKTGGEFGHRLELTIYWKKAYESSKASGRKK